MAYHHTGREQRQPAAEKRGASVMSDSHLALLADLRAIAGVRGVVTAPAAVARYCTGYRFGAGTALAVVRPGSLVELWLIAKCCIAADAIVILQAANTGLTGGSTPNGNDYDRPVVLVSTEQLVGIQLLDGGRQVVCLPGATLHALEQRLAPLGREPHSVIGSSCIGASVIGGVCNNSGGALIRRGPAYTQFALYARLDAGGELNLVNDLGIDLGDDPETILERLERGDYASGDVRHDPARRASDERYAMHVRDIDNPVPARFNADPRCLHGASGSAGRVIVFAVRLDTFPAERDPAVFYLGTNDPEEFTHIRRHMLRHFAELPIAAEYIHREAFDIAERYGKDTYLAIKYLGTARLPALFRMKTRLDTFARRLGIKVSLSDRLLQAVGRCMPRHLPERLLGFRNRFEHHLLLKTSAAGAAQARAYLTSRFPSASGEVFECTSEEASAAFRHRFAVAGAAVRYRALHPNTVGGIVALDIALPRNTHDWFETLPPSLDARITHKLYYGHFFCQVFHQDYLVASGEDPLAIEHAMWVLLDGRGAEYPAEHNVGHLYRAKPELAAFYRTLDPRNQFNPGIGRTSKRRFWSEAVTARRRPATEQPGADCAPRRSRRK